MTKATNSDITKLAAVKFPLLKRVRNTPRKTRVKNSVKLIDGMRPYAAYAIEIVSKTKPELIGIVKRNPELFFRLADDLEHCESDAKALLEFLTSAYTRLMVALAAVVEEQAA